MYLKNNRIQIDPETWLYEPNQRDDLRVSPNQLDPIILTVDEQLLTVFNFSAGGLACEAQHLLEEKSYQGRVNLPRHRNQRGLIFDVSIDVILIGGDIARCRFIDLAMKDVDAIHRYALKCQIAEIKENKKPE